MVNHFYFTDNFVEFYVPNAPSAPANGPVFFFWPGIESSDNHILLQPVLQWNQNGSGSWTMQDFAVSGIAIVQTDYPGIVYPGDIIYASISFYPSSYQPSSCVQGANGGANCIYGIQWADFTSGHLNSGGFFYTVAEPMTFAQGAVFEAYADYHNQQTETGFPTGCADFPGTSVFGTHYAIFINEYLSEWDPASGVTYSQDPPNFQPVQYPNAGSGPLTDINNHMINCGDTTPPRFSISAGCWFGNCNNYGFAVGY